GELPLPGSGDGRLRGCQKYSYPSSWFNASTTGFLPCRVPGRWGPVDGGISSSFRHPNYHRQYGADHTLGLGVGRTPRTVLPIIFVTPMRNFQVLLHRETPRPGEMWATLTTRGRPRYRVST